MDLVASRHRNQPGAVARDQRIVQDDGVVWCASDGMSRPRRVCSMGTITVRRFAAGGVDQGGLRPCAVQPDAHRRAIERAQAEGLVAGQVSVVHPTARSIGAIDAAQVAEHDLSSRVALDGRVAT